jgi:hypothetical protein
MGYECNRHPYIYYTCPCDKVTHKSNKKKEGGDRFILIFDTFYIYIYIYIYIYRERERERERDAWFFYNVFFPLTIVLVQWNHGSFDESS